MTVVVQPRPLNVRKSVFVGTVLVVFFVYTYFLRPSPAPENVVLEGETMGTTYTVKIVGSPLDARELRTLSADLSGRLDELNRQMSTYLPDSEITRFNQSTSTDPFAVSEPFAAVVRRALAISRATGGAFDPTLGPLIDLWGFGQADRADTPPTQAQIREALASCGNRHIRVHETNDLEKDLPALQVNLDAIAKGFGVDVLTDLLAERSLTNAYVEIGGEVRVRGHNPQGGPWRIGIDTPNDRAATGEQLSSILALSDRAVATSGDYRNYYEDASGTRRSHLIDPRTGTPVSHRLASATVTAPDCMTADALATALMVLGPTEAQTWVEAQPGIEALLIIRTEEGFEMVATPGLEVANAAP